MHTHYADKNFRLWTRSRQIIEVSFRRQGVGLSIEFPSDWHDEQSATLYIGLWLVSLYVMVPWPKRYPDHYQCSGPTFGFKFFEDLLWIYHGNSTGRSKDGSSTTIYMPWHWSGCIHEVLNAEGDWEPYGRYWKGETDGRVEETFDYTYRLKNGEIQRRKAAVYVERRTWSRWWLPHKKTIQGIDVTFNGEVGERTGSWKGGTIGCDYEMLPGETPEQTLRRMEKERKF